MLTNITIDRLPKLYHWDLLESQSNIDISSFCFLFFSFLAVNHNDSGFIEVADFFKFRRNLKEDIELT